MKIKNINPSNNVLYTINERDLKEISIGSIGRDLSKDEIETVEYMISQKIFMLVHDAVREVSSFSELLKRDIGKKNENPRYEIYWKNENIQQNTFLFVGAFKDVDDAKTYSEHEYWNARDEYKIVMVNKNIQKLISHHKNQDPHLGIQGFHMDVHYVPKSSLNHPDF